MGSKLLTATVLLSAVLAGPPEPREELPRDVLCPSGPAFCCPPGRGFGVLGHGCSKVSPTPARYADLVEACSALGGAPSCCNKGLLGLLSSCQKLDRATCSPTPGFNYSIFTNPFPRDDKTAPYPNFDPSVFTDSAADLLVARGGPYTSVPAFDVPADRPSEVYATPNVTAHQKTVVGHGYFFSPVAQNVTLFARALDIVFVYSGAAAIAGFDRDNWTSFYEQTHGDSYVDGVIVTPAGSYTPVRWVVGFSVGADTFSAQLLLAFFEEQSAGDLYSTVCEPGVPQFKG